MSNPTEEIEALKGEVLQLKSRLAMVCGKDDPCKKLVGLFRPRSAQLLAILARRAPEVISKQTIYEAMEFKGSAASRSLDVLVWRTRRRIADKEIPGFIETVQSRGYRVDQPLAEWVKSQIDEPQSREQAA